MSIVPFYKLLGASAIIRAIGEILAEVRYSQNAKTERELLKKFGDDPDRWHMIRMGDVVFSRGELDTAEHLTGAANVAEDNDE